MKRTWIPVLLLIAVLSLTSALAQSGPLDGPEPPPAAKGNRPAPDAITCISANVNGQEIHRDLPLPIKASDHAQIRLAFLRWAQELSVLASNEKSRGAAMKMANDFAMSTEASSRNTYITGFVCYVMAAYCDPSCFGNGCAHAKFFYQ